MLFGRKIYADTFSEIHSLIRPWLDGEFWDFESEPVRPGSIYVVGRQQTKDNTDKFRTMAEQHGCCMILSNPHEGSKTMVSQIIMMGLEDLARQHRMLIVGGGDMSDRWPCMRYDSFLARILDYPENQAAVRHTDSIFSTVSKPYSFLFLNGTARPHRQWMIDRMQHLGLLDRALWTNLDSNMGPIRLLPPGYELERYRNNLELAQQSQGFVKDRLFGQSWGEVYLEPRLYVDTYFSVITETVFDYAHSFRTEKIAKVLAMGHPWLAVANAGFYRDLRDLGFRTFDSIIDERFDSIDSDIDRLEAIAAEISRLCAEDLPAFLAAAQPVCKYNQQHLNDLIPDLRQKFVSRFFNFLLAHTHG